MSLRDKWVRRFSVDETAKHKNGFTIYKITSVLFPLESPEAVTVVSVWKRYSDIQQLHKSMSSLHAGLHLRGNFPPLDKSSYFKRFQQEVIDERAKTIKVLLEFIAEHRLLFTSTDFVNFLQTGYPEPESKSQGVINAIRTSLHLPLEQSPPLEYQTEDHTEDEDCRSSRADNEDSPVSPQPTQPEPQTEFDVSQIPIYEAAEVEIRESPKTNLSPSSSFESINSLDTIDSDLYDELSKITIDKSKPCIKKNVLPDLINFDVPSTSKYDDYHTMPKTNFDTESLGSVNDTSSTYETDSRRSSSRISRMLSHSSIESKTKTEDSYIFEAGYLLNLAARCEDMEDYARAFEFYKSGIEKMLIGVQSDPDRQRKSLIKDKINKYLSYAETIYRDHLFNTEQTQLLEAESPLLHVSLPLSMLQLERRELARFRVMGTRGRAMLVLDTADHKCYAMKVIQKVPNNLTEFDSYFQHRANETRQPILPTVIPYMVPIHGFIETEHLIFLILTYAAGEKLFDYIKNYTTQPVTPAKVNLENVFPEPIKKSDIQNDNVDVADVIEIDKGIDVLDFNDNTDLEISVNELVINSQKLLLNVDKALTEVPKLSESNLSECDESFNKFSDTKLSDKLSDVIVQEKKDCKVPEIDVQIAKPLRTKLPAGTVRQWGAEILTALESLHNCGVICRDLNPDNILLGSQGQITLTYFVGYSGVEMALAKVRACKGRRSYVAPELYTNVFGETEPRLERVCDFWSFGVIMYRLICGECPQFPAAPPPPLALEERSLLTQLLTHEPSERLGAGKDGIEEIKRHPYFKAIDWQTVYRGWVVPG